MSHRLTHFMILLVIQFICLASVCPSSPAEELMRTWKGAAGKFTVEAKLVEIKGDKVRLLKRDGKTVDVPISKLSDADSEYLKSRNESENPFAGDNGETNGLTGAEAIRGIAGYDKAEPLSVAYSLQNVPSSSDIAGLPDTGTTIQLSKSEDCEALTVDPSPPRPMVKPGQVNVAQTDAYDDPSGLITLNSKQALVAVSIGRAKVGMNEPHVGRLLVGQLPKGPFQLVFERDKAIKLLDHNEATGQTLMMSDLDGFKRGGEIVVLEGLVEGKPQEEYRRRLPGMDKPGFLPQVTRAKLIDKDVAVVVLDSALYCWNLRTSTLLYRTEANSINGPTRVSFSGSGKYLAISHDKGFSLIESASGEQKGYVETESPTPPGVCFHPDGRRIAYSSGNSWGVWDTTGARKLMSGIVTEQLGENLVGWFGNDWFMTDLGNVVDTNSQMLVWMYYTGAAEGKNLWTDSMSVLSKVNGLKVETLPVPDKKALAAIKKLDQQKNLMVTSPGTEVSIRIESTETIDKKELEEALKISIERAGWVVKPSAKLAVVAKIGRGKPYSLQYSMSRIGGAGEGQIQTVEIKPFTAVLEIRSGKEVLWTRNTENHVPSLLFLRGDETAQDAVNKFERPQPEFFSSIQIPPRIPKRDLVKGLGASRMDKGVWADFAR